MKRNLYCKLPLNLKIILPFLAVSVSLLLLVTATASFWLSHSIEQMLGDEIGNRVSLVLGDFKAQQQLLQGQAQMLASSDGIRQALERGDADAVREPLLPVKTALGLDMIEVVDERGAVVAQLREEALAGVKLRQQQAIALALKGQNKSGTVSDEGQSQVFLVGFAPIKPTDKAIGGVILGKLLSDKLLEQLNVETNYQQSVAVFYQGRLIATNLPESRNASWQPPSPQDPPTRLTIQRRAHTVKSAALSETGDQLLAVVLHPMAPLEQTELAMSQKLGSFFWVGAILAALAGSLVARMVAQPIVELTRFLRWIAATGDFTTKVPVTSGDEVGELAQAFNFMVEQLAERDRKLNMQVHQLEQALHDLKLTQSQLIQAEKMSSLGMMVAGIAHEINNPVNFIYGNIRHAAEYTKNLLDLIALYQEHCPNPSPVIHSRLQEIDLEFVSEDLPKLLSSMKMGAERIQQIILSMRNFSRLDEAEMKEVDLHEGIDSTLLILNSRLKKGIAVIKRYGNLPKVECFPAQLNQVFMNILANAIDAVNSSDKKTEKRIEIHTESAGDNLVMVRFLDNGQGIEPAVIDKLFDPFFTTKPVGKGTGLGLAISYQIVQKHGGDISVNSPPGKGVEFCVFLPIKHAALKAKSF
jgi:signal transduction histidine kinase